MFKSLHDFKLASSVGKGDDTLNARYRRTRKSQGVVLCSYNIFWFYFTGKKINYNIDELVKII